MSKLLSGKFLLTVIAGLTFAYGVVTGYIPSDKATEVILIVVYAYFNKKEDKQ